MFNASRKRSNIAFGSLASLTDVARPQQRQIFYVTSLLPVLGGDGGARNEATTLDKLVAVQ